MTNLNQCNYVDVFLAIATAGCLQSRMTGYLCYIYEEHGFKLLHTESVKHETRSQGF